MMMMTTKSIDEMMSLYLTLTGSSTIPAVGCWSAVRQREGAAEAEPKAAANSGMTSERVTFSLFLFSKLLPPIADHIRRRCADIDNCPTHMRSHAQMNKCHVCTIGVEAEAKGGQAVGNQPAREVEERARGPQKDRGTESCRLNEMMSEAHF